MTILDRRGTVVGSAEVALKAPCLVATTGASITLSGVQAIDGVTVGNNAERVLVKDQSNPAQNGIYLAQTGPWLLVADWANSNNVLNGTLVLVTNGLVNNGVMFQQTCNDNPIVIGTSLIAFKPAFATFPSPQNIGSSSVLSVMQYGAVGDGVTDDTTALTRWINALLSGTATIGTMPPAKKFLITQPLPQITVHGLQIIGGGSGGNHNVGSEDVGTTILWGGSSGATMWTMAPSSGSSNQFLSGVRLSGITLDANSLAAKALVLQSIRNGDFDLTLLNATTTALELGVVATLGEARDLQMNRFRAIIRQAEAAGTPMTLNGDSGANISENWFELIDIRHNNTAAVVVNNADNNLWGTVRTFSGGSPPGSIIWNGGATEAQSARAETILKLSCTHPAVAKGTGSFTVAAQNIRILGLDKDNNSPDPTAETGASVHWQNTTTQIFDGGWTSYVPTVTPASNSFTTLGTPSGRYRKSANKLEVEILVPITTNGSASGAVNASLPFPSGASAIGNLCGSELSAGAMLQGLITAGSSTVRITKYDSTYPGGDGKTLSISGFYEAVIP